MIESALGRSAADYGDARYVLAIVRARNNNKEGSSELLGPSDAVACEAMAVSTEVACFVIYIYAPLHNL